MSAPQDPFGDPTSGQPPYGQQYGQPPYGQQSGQPPYGPPPQPYGQQPGWGPSGPGYGVTQTETKAVVALVLAIGSFVVFPFVPAVAALVLASMSSRDIAASGGRLTGSGLVTAAKVVAWINVGLCLVGLVGLVALLGLASSGV